MEFPQTIWLDVHEGACDLLRHREVRHGVLDFDPAAAARCHLLCLFRHLKDVLRWDGALWAGDGFLVGMTEGRRWHGALVDVRVFLRYVSEQACVDPEVLRDNGEWSVSKPVGQHERRACGVKVAVGKYEQNLQAIVESLNAMRNARWEAEW